MRCLISFSGRDPDGDEWVGLSLQLFWLWDTYSVLGKSAAKSSHGGSTMVGLPVVVRLNSSFHMGHPVTIKGQ